MQDRKILERYRLDQLKVVINQKNNYQTSLLEKDSALKGEGENANLIEIESKIIVRGGLNHCLKPKAELFKIWIRNKCIAVNLETREGVYSFETMNYFFFLTATSNGYQEKVIILVEEASSTYQSTTISFKLIVHQEGKVINQLSKNKEISIEFGSTKRASTVKFEVISLSISSARSSQVGTQQSKLDNKFEFIDNKSSTPLGVITSPGQIYEILKVPSPSIVLIESFLKQIAPYSSPSFPKDNQLYFCHDMKGGYIEDQNFDNNSIEILKYANLHYRCLQLEQSEIFNYFSHYNITIPPLHWRIACRTAKTKCLGTFIIEHPVYSQNTLVSQEFALFLVAIARRCQFDGYLINIQTKIINVAAFKKWLGYLTTKLHEYIPNAVIIWYDSISQKDGNIRYQNCLSGQNIDFYNLTDGLFTNYWWNEDLLRKTVQLKNYNPKKVYIGNDCFGRNTYGGGMYQIYKAANKILQHKNQLSIALFAPGWTYQDNAENNRELFLLNELSMYKGMKSQLIPVEKWKLVNKGDGWNQEGDWWVTSFDVCERSAIFNFPPLQPGSVINAKFMVRIMGTAPIIDSPYKVVMQVIDDGKNVVEQNEAHNFNNYKKTTDKDQLCVYQVNITEEMVGSKPYSIKIIEMGKSREYWGGHYGPRFKNDSLYVLIYQKQRHWVNKIPVNQVKIGQTYHTLCNLSVGDYFYHDGIQMQPNYSFLADFDLPHTHIINHPFDTELNFKNAFIGATSLSMKKEILKLLKVFIPKGLNLKKQYFIQVTVKDTPKIDLIFKYISKLEEERIFTTKLVEIDDVNEWKKFTFKLETSLNEVKSDIRSIIDINSSIQPYCLGEIKIIQREVIQKAKLVARLEVSRDYVPTNRYYLNVHLQSQTHKRLLVLLSNIAAFAYFQQGKADLSNLSIEKSDQFSVKILDVDSALEHIPLCQKTIESQYIAALIFNGSIQL